MLKFHNVSFEYPNQPVFDNLNVGIENGEFIFLIGKSGTGKTTLLQMVYMNLLPQSGYVEVDGYNSKSIKKSELPYLRRKVGVVFQDFKLLDDRTVYDNLAFVLKITGNVRSQIKRKIVHALTDVGLVHKQHNMPQELSGGEQQRVAIARAIINDPMLILADEPTGNLDPETSMEIFNILKRINLRGTTVIFATHNYDLVRKHEAKIIKLNDGKAVRVILKNKGQSTSEPA
ncbi:MAG: cell division ATP-binding protein FtsE [Bacteroidetes bacterium]|nr:cell division ATP-binding protein FtsE [Bacteroidota bacterium]